MDCVPQALAHHAAEYNVGTPSRMFFYARLESSEPEPSSKDKKEGVIVHFWVHWSSCFLIFGSVWCVGLSRALPQTQTGTVARYLLCAVPLLPWLQIAANGANVACFRVDY
jgi:hypothetical protein